MRGMNRDDFITHLLLARASVEFQDQPDLTLEDIYAANRKQLDQLRQKALVGRASRGQKAFYGVRRDGLKKSSKETCEIY